MLRRLPGSLALLLSLWVQTTACSAATGRRERLVDSEIAALKERVLELQRQSTVDKVEIDRLRQKVAALETRLEREAEERRAEAEKATAPRGLEAEAVPVPRQVAVIEVSDLEEPIEEPVSVEPGPAPASAADGAAEGPAVDAALTAPAHEPGAVPEPAREPPAATAPPSPDPAAAAAAAAPAGGETRITAAAQALYDQGYSLYHQGRYVDAEETFHRFLAAYAATDLGDNARYWIGECRLARNELQGALAAFREAVREHPSGNKTPDALLRAGEVQERLGDVEGARTTYREVSRRYPESAAATEAADRLRRL